MNMSSSSMALNRRDVDGSVLLRRYSRNSAARSTTSEIVERSESVTIHGNLSSLMISPRTNASRAVPSGPRSSTQIAMERTSRIPERSSQVRSASHRPSFSSIRFSSRCAWVVALPTVVLRSLRIVATSPRLASAVKDDAFTSTQMATSPMIKSASASLSCPTAVIFGADRPSSVAATPFFGAK